MDPIKLDGMLMKSRAELTAQLQELKAARKKLKEERSLPGAKVIARPLSSLSLARLSEAAKKKRAALREAYKYKKCKPLNLRRNSQEDPCCTAASPPAFSEDGEGKEA